MRNKFIRFLRDNLWVIWGFISLMLFIFDLKAGIATWIINLFLIGITAYVVSKINFSLNQVKEILKELEEATKSLKENKKFEFVFNNQYLSDVYNKEFFKEKHRLEKDSNNKYTCNIGDYIDKEFIDSTVNKSFLNICPGLMTGLGILGTFLGLTLALQNFNITGSADDIVKSISPLMNGIKIAFHTSIYGMLFSLTFNWIFKEVFDEAYRVLDDFLSEYDFLLGNSERNNEKNFLVAIEELSKSIVSKFDSVGKNIESKLECVDNSILTKLGSQIGSELNSLFKPSLDNMNNTLENLSNNFNKNQIDYLSEVVKEFVNQMNASLGNNFAELGKKIKDILQFQSENNTDILVMLEKFRTTTENIEKINMASADTIKAFSEYIDKVENLQKNIIENIQPIVDQLEKQNKNNIELQNRILELIKYGDNISSASKDFSEEIADNVKVFSELNISIQDSIKNIHEKSEDYTRNMKKLSEEISEDYKKKLDIISTKATESLENVLDSSKEYNKEVTRLSQFISEEYKKNLTIISDKARESLENLTDRSEKYNREVKKISEELLKTSIKTLIETTEMQQKGFNNIVTETKKILIDSVEIDKENRKKEIEQITIASLKLLDDSKMVFQNMLNDVKDFSKIHSQDMEKAAKEISKLSIALNQNLSESLKECLNVFDDNLSKISTHLSGTILKIENTIDRVPKVVSASCEDLDKSFKEVKNIVIMAKNLKIADSQRLGTSSVGNVSFLREPVKSQEQVLKSVNLSKNN